MRMTRICYREDTEKNGFFSIKKDKKIRVNQRIRVIRVPNTKQQLPKNIF